MSNSLAGVVLTGGFSSRMGRDKALIEYHGEPHYLYTAKLLKAAGLEVFISCRADQLLPGHDALVFPRLHDAVQGQGPIAGILSALAAKPGHAVLAVACDLPRLNRKTIDHLVHARDPARLATCYRSEYGGLPEPLCAIYEPAMQTVFEEALSSGIRCPRKVLMQNLDRVNVIEPVEPGALDNFNSPADIAGAQA
jgi:molybdopterin-guanine dinucleotide biosynthesis protein A